MIDIGAVIRGLYARRYGFRRSSVLRFPTCAAILRRSIQVQRECQYDGWCVYGLSFARGVMRCYRAQKTAWCGNSVAVSMKKLLSLLCGCKHVKQYRRGVVEILTFGPVRRIFH